MQPESTIRFETGTDSSGDALLALVPTETECSESFFNPINSFYKIYCLYVPPLHDRMQVEQFADTLCRYIEERKLRRLSALSVGNATFIVLQVALLAPRLLRRMLFINPSVQVQPGGLEGFFDLLEQKLPLGFPIRPRSKYFDARSFLHRIQHPSLILQDGELNRSDAALLANLLPNAWLLPNALKINSYAQPMSQEIVTIFQQLKDVEAKRPQKNLEADRLAHSG